jgi:hypothetical protein
MSGGYVCWQCLCHTAKRAIQPLTPFGGGLYCQQYQLRWQWQYTQYETTCLIARQQQLQDAGGGGGGNGGPLSSFRYSNDYRVTTNSEGSITGVRVNWSEIILNGEKSNDAEGVSSRLNELVKGTKFIRSQNLWNGAMMYGERHRDAYKSFLTEYRYDVMWQHNYNVYLDRKKSGAPLSKQGDRGSYTESLAQFENVNRAHVEGRMLEAGFVGALAAPLILIEAAPAIVFLSENAGTAFLYAHIRTEIFLNVAKGELVKGAVSGLLSISGGALAYSQTFFNVSSGAYYSQFSLTPAVYQYIARQILDIPREIRTK